MCCDKSTEQSWLYCNVALFVAHTLAEERDCAARFGAEWQRYAAAVPRFNVALGLLRARRRRPSAHGP